MDGDQEVEPIDGIKIDLVAQADTGREAADVDFRRDTTEAAEHRLVQFVACHDSPFASSSGTLQRHRRSPQGTARRDARR